MIYDISASSFIAHKKFSSREIQIITRIVHRISLTLRYVALQVFFFFFLYKDDFFLCKDNFHFNYVNHKLN